MGKVYLFNVNIFKGNQIDALCKSLGHSLIYVKKEDYSKTLGEIVGIVPGKKRPANTLELPNEMMLFVGIDSNALDDFLDGYKKAGILPIPRKAIMTPTNCNWTVKQLYDDLEEHIR